MIATQDAPSEACRLGMVSDVPKGWRVERAKVFFRKVDERSEKGEEELLSVSHLTGVTRRSEKNVTMFQAESYAGFKTCQAGDIVVNSMWAWMKALGVAWEPGIISTAYGVYRLRVPEDWNLRFIDYLARCDFMGGEYLIRSKGIHSSRWLLSDDDFGNVPFICPPRPEQDAIVAYLDGKLETIDRYLRVKEREIALLEERKRALIHRAVTRGLDPNPKLEASGSDWLPQIPVGWQLLPLKRAATLQTGITLGKTYTGDRVREYPYLRVANVQNGYLYLEEVTTIRMPDYLAAKVTLRSGDVLVAEGGDLDKLGRGCVWRGEIGHCLHQNHVFAVRPDLRRLNPDFLSLSLGSAHGQLYFMLTGKQTTNLASTNSTSLMRYPVPLPSLSEQDKILQALGSECEPIDTTITRARRQIERMQEYRTALIAEAVTGKIDVTTAS